MLLQNTISTVDFIKHNGLDDSFIKLDFLSQSASVANIETKNGMDKEVLSSTMYPEHGYYVREESVRLTGQSEEPVVMRSAYNMDGDYIGSEEDAQHLCVKLGIRPELAQPENKVCSVGYSERDGKWYGWSHRAINGFQPGDSIKKGDSAYRPDTLDNFVQDVKRFWDKSDIEILSPTTVKVISRGKSRLCHEEKFEPGKGEWSVLTIDDAREAAKDFAESVSSSYADSAEDALELAASVAMVSESAKNKDPKRYAWYRFTGKRARNYNNHHRVYDMSIDPNEVFGIRFDKRTGTMRLIQKEALDLEFTLSVKEGQLLLRNTKPFGGKILNMAITKGDGQVYQMDAPKSKGKVERVDSLKGIVDKKVESKPIPVYWCGYKLANVKKARVYFNTRKSALVKAVNSAVKDAENVASKPVMGQVTTHHPVFKNVGKAGFANVHEAHLDEMIKSPDAKEVHEIKVKLFTDSVEVPRYNATSPERKQPYFKGNERQVLRELRNFVMYDKHFTASLSFLQDGKIADKKAVTNKGSMFGIKKVGDVERLTFVTKQPTQAFFLEAQGAVRRIKMFYPRGLFKFTIGKAKRTGHTVVHVDLKLSKQTNEQAERSKMLYDLVNKNSLVLDTPKYEDRNGKTIQLIEVDIEKGKVRAIAIREQSKAVPFNVTELFTKSGEQLF